MSTQSGDVKVAIGKNFFKLRDYTPIPLLLVILIFAKPTALSIAFGLLFMALGEGIRIFGVSFIGTVSRTRNDHGGNKLVTTGPFAMVRNPLYVGNFFLCFGIATWSGSLALLILTVVLFALQYYYIVKYEESLLVGIYGDEYRQYCSKVAPWVPNLAAFPYDDLPQMKANLAMAMKSEKKTLISIVAVLLLLIWRSC